PARLRTRLGQPITVGGVEVTPQKVERRPVRYITSVRGEQAESAPYESLVMTLQLKNVSTDEYFDPTDPMFQQQYLGSGRPPYTSVEFLNGAHKPIFGGPLDLSDRDERIEGQPPGRHELAPGGSVTTVVATPPERKDEDLLKNYQGDYLWRVQVRRGLVE